MPAALALIVALSLGLTFLVWLIAASFGIYLNVYITFVVVFLVVVWLILKFGDNHDTPNS